MKIIKPFLVLILILNTTLINAQQNTKEAKNKSKYKLMNFGYNNCNVNFGSLKKHISLSNMIKLADKDNAKGFTYHSGLKYGEVIIGNYPEKCKSPSNESWPLYLKVNSNYSLSIISETSKFDRIIKLQKNEIIKERKKIIKYFNNNEFEKAENYALKKEKKIGKSIYLIIAENYFLSAKKDMKIKKNILALEMFNKSISFFEKGNYSDINFIKKEMGLCYLSIHQDNKKDIVSIKEAYKYFSETNSNTLLSKYEDYFAAVYIDKYKVLNDDSFLVKAYSAYNNSTKILDFKDECTEVSELLLDKHNQKNNELIYLDKSIVLLKKLDKTKMLAIAYKNKADYYINYTKTPKKALDFISLIKPVDKNLSNKYINIVNAKLIENCNNFKDCIKVCDENPNLKLNISEKAISLATTVENCITAEEYFSTKKELIENQVLKNITTVSSGKKALEHFPTKKDEIENKILKFSLSFEDLGYVYENYPNLLLQAEQKAIKKVTSLNDKKEFVKYFQNSSYALSYQDEIKSEEDKIRRSKMLREEFEYELDDVAEEIGKLIMDAHHRYGKGLSTNLNDFTVKENIASLNFSASWYATSTLGDRILDFSIEFPIRLNLEKESVSIGWVKNTFDGKQYHLKKFNRVKSQVMSSAKTLIDDIKTFHTN